MKILLTFFFALKYQINTWERLFFISSLLKKKVQDYKATHILCQVCFLGIII